MPTSLPAWLSAGLAILPLVYLILAVLFAVTGSAYVICRYDPFVGFFRLGATSNMLVVGGCLIVISLFIGRPYCRFLCPYDGNRNDRRLSKVCILHHMRAKFKQCISMTK